MREDHIWVPRRLIYGQAALLGVSAVTFFMLGMMVGNLTAPGRVDSQSGGETTFVEDCRISGTVLVRKSNRPSPDSGAVVMLLPTRVESARRLAPGLLMPETFVALDNPAIDEIHNAGGAVVRADVDGKFDVLVDRGKAYHLLILSKFQRSQGRTVDESLQKTIETWFAPAQKLTRDNDFQWKEINAADQQMELGSFEFD